MTFSLGNQPFNISALLYPDSNVPPGIGWQYDRYQNSTLTLTFSFSTNSNFQFQQIYQDAFSELQGFLNVQFSRVADQPEFLTSQTFSGEYGFDVGADLRLSQQSDTLPGYFGTSDVWWWNTDSDFDMEDIDAVNRIYAINSYTILHELGHALTLKHPSNFQSPTQSPFLLPQEQNNNYTVMHYDTHSQLLPDSSSGDWDFRHYQLYDVYALQLRFGANQSTYAGSDNHTTSSLGVDQWLKVLWDAAGTDTLDMSSESRAQLIDIRSGGFNNIGSISGNNPSGYNLAIAIGAQIENAKGGSGDDIINGNDVGNQLDGGLGADTIFGFAGDDVIAGGTGSANTLYGGLGNDIFIVQASGDSVIELAGEGTDEVRTALGLLTLAANVENLTYTAGSTSFVGLGNSLNNVITGGTGRDDLYGYAGDDTLIDGGVNNGNSDTLIGGTGNDIYIVTERTSSTIELAGEGIDEVRTIFSIFGLQSNVENLTYTDNAIHQAGVGNNLDNVIRGGTGGDDLFGRDGNDTLYGGSGTPNTLLGQLGDDTYVVDTLGDSVIEYVGEGIDTVRASVAGFTLPANVENLLYVGSGTFIGVGNALGNAITGGAGYDQLNGLDGNDFITGGSGADLLQGGTGADQFRYTGGETGLDRIIDFTGGSDKIALSTIGFTHTATVAFVSSGAPVATTSNSTFLYNVNNGIVSYDADGTGAGAAVQIAQLNAGLTLSAGDFIFY
jgi:Ca2+-binding RTX toxin-like protein